MKHFFTTCVILCALTFTSCSTLLSKKTQKLNVFSNAKNAQVTVNDSVYNLPAEIYVQRGRQPLKMMYQSNSKQVDTLLKARHSALFILGNLLNAPAFGAGYVVDLTNQKRFKYKKNIFFNDKDSLTTYQYKAERYLAKRNIVDEAKKDSVHQKFETDFFAADAKRKNRQDREFKRFNPTTGTFKFNIQPPTILLEGVSNQNEGVNKFSNTVGGFGLGLGFDYYYQNNRFLGIETSVRSNIFNPIAGPSDYINVAKYDISLRSGYRWKRFEAGYGISFVYTYFNYATHSAFDSHDDKNWHEGTRYRALGFSSLFHYQLTSVMYIGLRYSPSVYSFRQSGSGFDYEHVIGFDYRIKF